jgi:hypothetical protein
MLTERQKDIITLLALAVGVGQFVAAVIGLRGRWSRSNGEPQQGDGPVTYAWNPHLRRFCRVVFLSECATVALIALFSNITTSQKLVIALMTAMQGIYVVVLALLFFIRTGYSLRVALLYGCYAVLVGVSAICFDHFAFGVLNGTDFPERPLVLEFLRLMMVHLRVGALFGGFLAFTCYLLGAIANGQGYLKEIAADDTPLER